MGGGGVEINKTPRHVTKRPEIRHGPRPTDPFQKQNGYAFNNHMTFILWVLVQGNRAFGVCE